MSEHEIERVLECFCRIMPAIPMRSTTHLRGIPRIHKTNQNDMNAIYKYRLLSALQDEMTAELTWEAYQAAYGFLVGKYNYTVLRFLAGIVKIY